MKSVHAPTTAVTCGPRQHFFGYYEKTPWSANGRYLLAMETDLPDRMLTSNDAATVGRIDLAVNNAFQPLAQTRAWNWQQGCMLQWLPGGEIVYNDRDGDRFVAVILDIESGEKRVLPRPVYRVSHSGKFALSVDFARLQRCRPTTGYALPDTTGTVARYPEDDGVYRLDMETGESRLILSFAQIAALHPEPGSETTPHWFEHLVGNPDDSRFLFLHRWQPPNEKRMRTHLFTACPDGSDVYCVSDHGIVSHFDWKNPRQILAWAGRHDLGEKYLLFTDKTEKVEVIGEDVLTQDGHCSFSPDGRWVLTDTYPNADRISTLILYRWEDGQRFDIGRFYQPPHLTGHIRCDLHPRWNRRGNLVCIDSAHEGLRQMYVLDVSQLTKEGRSHL